MRGVILAGGKGTRLLPATKVMNKHLIPLGTTPMVEFPLRLLKKIGITEILLVTGGEHIGGFAEYLGDGSSFGVSLTYRVQQGANGIAAALALAEDFARKEPITVILGDNIFDERDFSPGMLPDNPEQALIFIKEVEAPSRFGVVEFDGQKKPVRIIEKPETPPSKFAVTGLYVFPGDVFGVIKQTRPSARGELEITEVNNIYLHQGRMSVRTINGFWSDAGTAESLFKAHEWLRGE